MRIDVIITRYELFTYPHSSFRMEKNVFLQLLKGKENIDAINIETALDIVRWIKERFPSATPYIFGSILKPELVHPGSDIDIVIEGLSDVDYCVLIKAVSKKFSSLKVDIRRFEEFDSYMRQKIADKGYKVKDGKEVRRS